MPPLKGEDPRLSLASSPPHRRRLGSSLDCLLTLLVALALSTLAFFHLRSRAPSAPTAILHSGSGPVVSLDYGAFLGRTTSSGAIWSFLGIPYAESRKQSFYTT